MLQLDFGCPLENKEYLRFLQKERKVDQAGGLVSYQMYRTTEQTAKLDAGASPFRSLGRERGMYTRYPRRHGIFRIPFEAALVAIPPLRIFQQQTGIPLYSTFDTQLVRFEQNQGHHGTSELDDRHYSPPTKGGFQMVSVLRADSLVCFPGESYDRTEFRLQPVFLIPNRYIF